MLSVAMLASTGSGIADAKKGQKNDVIKPDPDLAAARNKSDKIKDNGNIAEPGADKGIKDPGVKSCGNCGLTGREAAPPPVDDGATPPSVDIETGQMLDKGPRHKPHVTERNKSDTIKPDPPLAGERNKSDTIKPNPPEVARNKSDTIKPDPPLAAAGKNKSGWILPALGGIALVGTIVAVSGGGNPKSP